MAKFILIIVHIIFHTIYTTIAIRNPTQAPHSLSSDVSIDAGAR